MIVIVQENHSFDNYFGTYPTANGSLVDPIASELGSVVGLPDNVCLPLNGTCVRPQLSYASNSTNPVEGQETVCGRLRRRSERLRRIFRATVDDLLRLPHGGEPTGTTLKNTASRTTTSRAVLERDDPQPAHDAEPETPRSQADYGPPPYLPYADTLMSQL